MTQELITRSNADQAVTQLLCLILGGKHARASAHLVKHFSERLELCFKLVEQELELSLKSPDSEQKQAALTSAQRKFSSLQSLKTLDQLIREIEW